MLERWCSAFLKLMAPDKMSAFKPFCFLKCFLKSGLNRRSFNFAYFHFKGILLFYQSYCKTKVKWHLQKYAFSGKINLLKEQTLKILTISYFAYPISRMEDERRKEEEDYVWLLQVQSLQKQTKSSFIQCLEMKRNKFINIFITWVGQCWQSCLQLSGCTAFALYLNKIWQAQYVLCPVLGQGAFSQRVFWQKFSWNLGCLRSPTFPWGNLVDKGGQPQQKLTALQPLALQVWIHISYGWIKMLLKHRLYH